MVKNSGIEWTDDTFNPWTGCSKVSPACANCYAMDNVNRYGGDFLGRRVMTSDDNWKQPIKWNKEAEKSGQRRRVFCASLSDVFEDYEGPIVNHKGQRLAVWPNGDRIAVEYGKALPHVSRGPDLRWMIMSDARLRLFNLIDETPNLVWMLLTKRPENILKMWPKKLVNNALSPFENKRYNVWLGTTAENQEQADKRIPELLKCRDLAPVLFLSCEPLLGPIEFSDVGKRSDCVSQLGKSALDGIDWVICGGESGKNARPMHPQWARSMRDQCMATGTPFHFKQWGEWIEGNNFGRDDGNYNETDVGVFPESKYETHIWQDNEDDFDDRNAEELVSVRVGKKQAGRLLDGKEWNELPVEWHLQELADQAQELDMGY